MILVDTGPLLAVADADDANHRRCRTYFEASTDALVVPITVVPEVCYLLQRNLGSGAESAFLRAFPDELRLEPVTVTDLRRAADLVDRYADLGFGAVDASIVAVAERLGLTTIATVDHRHFSVVRPHHVAAFTLVP
jgi:uncharacterized protein